MFYLLVVGMIGFGKLVGVNVMIFSMLYKVQLEDVCFIMIDLKMLEFLVYEGILYLLIEVVIDMKDVVNVLCWSVNEMECCYKLMFVFGVCNLVGYNEKIVEVVCMGCLILDLYWKLGDSMDVQYLVLEKLLYIVVLVDEFVDLMMIVGKKVEELIVCLVQKVCVVGIYLVLVMQCLLVDVIIGLIKVNILICIVFIVFSKIDFCIIFDQGGVELLLGMGDMFYFGLNFIMLVCVYGVFVCDQEVYVVVQDWKVCGCL